MVRLIALLLLITGSLMAQKKGDTFMVSFGTGGVKYKLIDSTCYSYVLRYPKDEKRIPNMLNNTIISSVYQAGRDYRKKKANGFFNVKFFWQVVGKERIIVQVCGDVVRRE